MATEKAANMMMTVTMTIFWGFLVMYLEQL